MFAVDFRLKCRPEKQSKPSKNDDKKRCFHDRPYHDWTSDFMDALRYLALSIRRETMKREPLPTHAEHEYNIIGI